jgi:thymidylate kinase
MRAQKGYLNLVKKNKKEYVVLDTSKSIKVNEKLIYDIFLRRFQK